MGKSQLYCVEIITKAYNNEKQIACWNRIRVTVPAVLVTELTAAFTPSPSPRGAMYVDRTTSSLLQLSHTSQLYWFLQEVSPPAIPSSGAGRTPHPDVDSSGF